MRVKVAVNGPHGAKFFNVYKQIVFGGEKYFSINAWLLVFGKNNVEKL
jgi:hypothetical protein